MRALKRDDVDNPYVVDEFLANSLIAARHPADAAPLFVAAIRGNPYMPAYYKDLGDLYLISFRPALAWLCYDLGRALPGSAQAPVISKMNDYEAQLAKLS